VLRRVKRHIHDPHGHASISDREDRGLTEAQAPGAGQSVLRVVTAGSDGHSPDHHAAAHAGSHAGTAHSPDQHLVRDGLEAQIHGHAAGGVPRSVWQRGKRPGVARAPEKHRNGSQPGARHQRPLAIPAMGIIRTHGDRKAHRGVHGIPVPSAVVSIPAEIIVVADRRADAAVVVQDHVAIREGDDQAQTMRMRGHGDDAVGLVLLGLPGARAVAVVRQRKGGEGDDGRALAEQRHQLQISPTLPAHEEEGIWMASRACEQ